MRIYVDLDDTACRLLVAWLELIRDRLGEHITEADITSWGRLADLRYQGLLREPGLFRRLPAEKGCRQYLTVAKAQGHILHVVSAARSYNAEDKAWWVDRYLPNLFTSVILMESDEKTSPDKSAYSGPGRLLIDDAEHNLTAWRAAGGIACAFDRPWNQMWDGLRIEAWSELPALLAAIERGEAA